MPGSARSCPSCRCFRRAQVRAGRRARSGMGSSASSQRRARGRRWCSRSGSAPVPTRSSCPSRSCRRKNRPSCWRRRKRGPSSSVWRARRRSRRARRHRHGEEASGRRGELQRRCDEQRGRDPRRGRERASAERTDPQASGQERVAMRSPADRAALGGLRSCRRRRSWRRGPGGESRARTGSVRRGASVVAAEQRRDERLRAARDRSRRTRDSRSRRTVPSRAPASVPVLPELDPALKKKLSAEEQQVEDETRAYMHMDVRELGTKLIKTCACRKALGDLRPPRPASCATRGLMTTNPSPLRST